MRMILLLAALLGLTVSALSDDTQSTEKELSEQPNKQFFVQLFPQRPDWPNNLTDREKEIWAAHFAYLTDLTDNGICLTAGPVFNDDGTPWFGLIILDVPSVDKAREIMDKEPGTVNGITTYTVHDLHLALWHSEFKP